MKYIAVRVSTAFTEEKKHISQVYIKVEEKENEATKLLKKKQIHIRWIHAPYEKFRGNLIWLT